MFVVGAFFMSLLNLIMETNMSKKQPKTEETIDERLYRELGVIPVSQDHPIYSRGPSIRFISKNNKRKGGGNE